MLFGTNQDHGQRYNRRVVFDTVRVHGPLSRTEIARRAGLSYQSVSNMADALIESGLLIDARKRDGRRGQPPAELSINPDGAFSLGFSFDQQHLRGALVDLAGTPRAEIEIALRSPHPSVVLPLITEVAGGLMTAQHVPADRLYGLGLGMPGLSSDGRFISRIPSSSHHWLAEWTDAPIVERLQKDLDIAVFTDNDAAAAAIGELLYGEGRHSSDFVYIYISDGIGAGLVLGGRPYRGRSGMAGELGHIIVKPGGRSCPCGNHGCLETYVSLSAARREVLGEHASGNSAELVEALRSRSPAMTGWLRRAARLLRGTIVSLENFLDPDVIFIGGTLPEPILDSLVELIEPLTPSIAQRHRTDARRLVKAKVGLADAALGAAALPTFEQTAADLTLLLKQRRNRIVPASA